MHVIIYTLLLLQAIVYAVLMVVYRAGWERQPVFELPLNYHPATAVSVIVPARNEAANITLCIESLLAQDYPKELYEIIVVDDHSTDNTASIIRSYAGAGVRYVSLQEHLQQSGDVIAYKKLALATGIEQSKGSLIITTDADCTSGKLWLKHIVAKYEKDQAVMVVAPVNFTCDNSMVQIFQSLDFMSMQGITAATLQLKMGNMCNGANLGFSREAYMQVDGYKGIDHIASGDDYLLMMKLNSAYPGSVSYLKSTEAIVHTPPQPDWKGFLMQRVRWASKSGKYDDKKMTALLLFVYLFNFSFLVMAACSLIYPDYRVLLMVILIIKIVAELFYLYPVAGFFNKRRQLRVFPFLQPLHIIYIILAGFMGFVGVYSWKGRKVK